MVSYHIRRYQSFMLFWALTIAFNIRCNLSCAINTMTDKNDPEEPLTFDWSQRDITLLLSSFYWSYFILQIPGGWLSFKYGGKNLILKSILLNSLLTLMTPALVSIGNWEMLCAVRFLEGLSQGVLYPSIHSILAKWLPVKERAALGTFTYCGSVFGNIITYGFTHILVEICGIGWPVIFYSPGIFGLLFCVCWYLWGANTPREYKGISIIEIHHIEESLEEFGHEEWQDDKLPWKEVLNSGAFWSLTFTHCANTWGVWTFSQAPHFMIQAMGIEIWKRPLMTASPYIATMTCAMIFVASMKLCKCCKLISLTDSRKLFNTIAQWIPMVTMVILSYCKPGQTVLVVSLLLISAGLNGGHYLGFMINHIDLAPNFAGILMGFANCAANLLTFFTAFVQRSIMKDEANVYEWQIIMFVTAAFYFWGNMWFVLFGSAETQTWNNPPIKYGEAIHSQQ